MFIDISLDIVLVKKNIFVFRKKTMLAEILTK